MIISVINHTDGQVSDAEVQTVLRAINRQIREDFEPYWSFGAELRLEGRSTVGPALETLSDMRGDAVLYLWDHADVDGALGYHETNHRGIPYGFVFTEIADALGEDWSVTLSHEALELIGDPEVNLLVMGKHPANNRSVFHWFEMCDAVQNETYEIDGVQVSNFVLPLYFTGGEEKGGRNDFLGNEHGGQTLRSFGVNPGGYVGYYDPMKNVHETFNRSGDRQAKRRMKIKLALQKGRRAVRYQRFEAKQVLEPPDARSDNAKRTGAARGRARKKKR